MSERRKKSEVGSPKSEEKRKPERRKRKADSMTEAGNPKSKEKNTSAIDILKSEIQEPLTTHNSPLTNMEVHHHPDVEKKGLKEYILEGLMIFLAVTMGFFAESYREQLSEHSKEREYVINIKKDLVADTANLNVWIPALYTRMLGFDTLINYLEMPAPVKDGGNMYYLARYATRSTVFEPSDNTILEMKSSGNLRLIRKREIVNDLMNFERVAAHYKNLDDIAEKEDILCYPLIGQLFDATIFNKMVIYKKNLGSTEKDYAAGQRNTTVKPSGDPQLRSNNSDRVNLLIYYLHQRKSTFMGEIYDLYNQKNVAGSIIKKINKEYSMEDE